MKSFRRHPLACLAGAAFALAACGGGGGDGSGDDGSPPTETTISPLAEVMGWENPSPEEQNRRQLEMEELTAACMREEGWEYTPVDYSAMNAPRVDDEEMTLMNDPEAYGKKYGYGIVRNYEQYDLPNIETGNQDGMSPVTVAGEFEDPNQPYVESLTESEREQYYISLNGDPAIWEGSEDEDFVQPEPDEMGCQGLASAEVWGSNPADSDPDIQNRMNDYWENAESDPRLQDAYATWRDCMGDTIADMAVLDDPVDDPQDLYGYLDGRKWTLMGLEMEPYDESMDDGETPYVMASVNEDGTGVAYTGEQEAIPEADLEELRQEELAVWQTDFDCQQEAKISEIRHDLEQEFADELRADFPELAADEE